MKKLIIYNNLKAQENIVISFDKIWYRKHNPFLNRDFAKYYLLFPTKKMEEIQINLGTLNFNKGWKISQTLEKILNKSIKNAQEISKEVFLYDLMHDQPKLMGALNSIVLKFKYQKNLDIFDFVCEIFCRLLNGHYLLNGNKRLSCCYFINLLWYLGYYFILAKKEMTNSSVWKETIKTFIYLLEHKNEKILIKIKNWIHNNTIVGLNFR